MSDSDDLSLHSLDLVSSGAEGVDYVINSHHRLDPSRTKSNQWTLTNTIRRVTSDPHGNHVVSVTLPVRRFGRSWVLCLTSRLNPLTPCSNLSRKSCTNVLYCVKNGLTVIDFSENIRSIAELIVPEDDYRTIDAIHDQIDEEEAERREGLEQAHADLKGLLFTSPDYFTF